MKTAEFSRFIYSLVIVFSSKKFTLLSPANKKEKTNRIIVLRILTTFMLLIVLKFPYLQRSKFVATKIFLIIQFCTCSCSNISRNCTILDKHLKNFVSPTIQAQDVALNWGTANALNYKSNWAA